MFVKASGKNNFHSCHSNANIGIKERIIINIANMRGHATSFVESVITFTL
jgi:hypothetical protein